jgi:hypothetical protein
MRARFHHIPIALLLASALLLSSPTVAQKTMGVVVPERVAILVRPVLDELQHSRIEGENDRHLVDARFYALAKKQGASADEALVVLMCFDVMGESQEDSDAVIARGRKMLPYLRKYCCGEPKITGRAYPDSLLKSSARKQDDFQGAMKAIEQGWRGSWDNPQG